MKKRYDFIFIKQFKTENKIYRRKKVFKDDGPLQGRFLGLSFGFLIYFETDLGWVHVLFQKLIKLLLRMFEHQKNVCR